MRILVACPGAELGGCELYFLTLASAIGSSHAVELLSALPVEMTGNGHLQSHLWPSCSGKACGGHAPDFEKLLSTGYDQVVLVMNSPEPVAGPCFDPLTLAVAASDNGVAISSLVQFVPSKLNVEPTRASTLAALARRGAMACVSTANRATLAGAIDVDAGCIALIRNGVLPRVVHNAEVAGARRTLRQRLGATAEAFVVVTHGRFVASKRHEDLLEAVQHLRGGGLDVHLLWPGAGEREQYLRAEVSRRGLRDWVHFLGHLDDVTPILLAADAGAFPSTEEGMSFSLLEAMAVGLPVVAARATSHPELIRHGANGLLAKPGSGASFGNALADLLLDRAKAAQLGAAAQEFQRRWCDASQTLNAAVSFLVHEPNS